MRKLLNVQENTEARAVARHAGFVRRKQMQRIEAFDQPLAGRLKEQISLWHMVRVVGSDAEIVEHSEAVIRGIGMAEDAIKRS